MRKTYRSATNLSFNVLINGRRNRVSFEPLTGGGSIYTSYNRAETEAIEKNSNFGAMFYLESSEDDEVTERVRKSTLKAEKSAHRAVIEMKANDPNDENELEMDSQQHDSMEKDELEADLQPNDLADKVEGEDLKVATAVRIETVRSFAEASAFLKQHNGGKFLRSKDSVLESAKTLGFEFPNLAI